MFDIDGILPDEAVGTVQPGTNLLISGPPMVGKHDLALKLLTAGLDDGEGLMCVSTDDSAPSLVEAISRHETPLKRNHIGIVSCVGRNPSQVPDGVETEFVSAPSDLTGISIGTVKILRALSDRDVAPVRHGVLSVTTLQKYLDTRTVFQFLHIYTNRVSDTGGLGIFTLDSSSEGTDDTDTLFSEFDGVIGLRERDDGTREVRLTGIPSASRTWYRY